MMKFARNIQLFAAVVPALMFWSCSKKWDDHNAITDSNLGNNLAEAIAKTNGLAKFNDLLVKSGYDKIIASSKTYTVWAPTDQALQSLDPAIVNDSSRLKLFIGNHISNQSYFSGGAAQRIPMLNGKYNLFAGTKFDSANITTANQYAKNGVFHIIDKFIPRIDNAWEWILNSSAAPLMKNFLLTQNYISFDSTKATQIGVNPNTGKPIWDSTNGKIGRNYFLDLAANVSDESGLYTMFVLNDAAYTAEFNKLTPWFKTSTTDSTNFLSGFHLVKDLGFKGLYSIDQLPDTLVSSFGVKVPIKKSAITASYKTSNGIVYVMNEMNFTLSNKFPPVIIQGENPVAFAAERPANTFYRVRKNPNTGEVFSDILMQNYNYASFYIRYLARNLNSMRYNAYWVSVNDVQTTPLWQQRLAIDSSNNVNLPYVTVAYQNYNEVSLGQWANTRFRNVNFFVVGPTTASSSGGSNSISLDYIKLVPAF